MFLEFNIPNHYKVTGVGKILLYQLVKHMRKSKKTQILQLYANEQIKIRPRLLLF